MSSTDIRRRNRFVNNTNNVGGIPVSSDSASDADALVYDSTSGYYELKKIMTTSGTQNVFSNKTFTGWFRIGANGVAFTEIRHGILDYDPMGLASNADSTRTVTFSPAFSEVPTVMASIEGTNSDDFPLTLIVNGPPTTTTAQFKVTNEDSVATQGRFRIHWLAYTHQVV